VDDPTKCHSHPEFPDTWPSKSQVYDYKQKVRSILLEPSVLSHMQKKCPHIAYLVYEHEMMHLETLFYMLIRMDDRGANGSFLNIPTPPLVKSLSLERRKEIDSEPSVLVQGGYCYLGREDGGKKEEDFGWDIEFPSYRVSVKTFRMHKFPVTIGQFYEFVRIGGYRLPEYWNEEDIKYMKNENIWFPSLWKCLFSVDQLRSAEEFENVCVSPGQFLYRMPLEDVSLEEALYLPVYVSLAEAEAYAKWKGKRYIHTHSIFGYELDNMIGYQRKKKCIMSCFLLHRETRTRMDQHWAIVAFNIMVLFQLVGFNIQVLVE